MTPPTRARCVLLSLSSIALIALVALVALVAGCDSPPAAVGRADGGVRVEAGEPADRGSRSDGSVLKGCKPPDILFLLDRTMSMHKGKGIASNWILAINAIESLVAAADATARFGLTLFPKSDPGCITAAEIDQGKDATNPRCQAGETLVPPALNTTAAIGSALAPDTPLCQSTPITPALGTAVAALDGVRDSLREQYIVLITDGQNDTCSTVPPLDIVQDIYLKGRKTYVVGFAGGIDEQQLNDLACAGGTAPGFPTGCVADSGGRYRAVDPAGATLFHIASDASTLSAALRGATSEVCCGCVLE